MAVKNRLRRVAAWVLGRIPNRRSQVLRLLFETERLTPILSVQGYQLGLFPMPNDAGQLEWCSPDPRAYLPVGGEFHVPKTLARVVRQNRFDIRIDTAFNEVLQGCSEIAPGRTSTWITSELFENYKLLHRLGVAHSVESWQGDQLVGGLLGVALGGFFSTESQFHRVRDAGKVALVHLNTILADGGFVLHDVQTKSSLLEQFGCREMARDQYEEELAKALLVPASFGIREPMTLSVG